MVGHSSGATLAATIAGYRPGLIQKVMAYEGNYDVDYYRQIRGWKNNYHATDFMTYKDDIDKNDDAHSEQIKQINGRFLCALGDR